MRHRFRRAYVPGMRTAYSTIAVVTIALGLGACGQSAEEKAQAKVCDARDDISKQVDELTNMTAATVTMDAVKQNLDAIRNDLKEISEAQSDLSGDRRSEVEAANKKFASSVKETASQALSSMSASDAKTALATSAEQLKASYQDAFAPVNCD
jgi:uncharacterized protein YjbJ (UPF0337 family)